MLYCASLLILESMNKSFLRRGANREQKIEEN